MRNQFLVDDEPLRLCLRRGRSPIDILRFQVRKSENYETNTPRVAGAGGIMLVLRFRVHRHSVDHHRGTRDLWRQREKAEDVVRQASALGKSDPVLLV